MTSLFDPSRNSFGLLRLLLALAVVVSHAWPLGGFGPDPGRDFNNLGILAVECFFALSGFLITRSGERLSVGRFLAHRMLRILPGVWIALLFVAALAAPIVWSISHPLSEYFRAQPGPLAYLANNVLLQNGQQSIGDTLSTNPFPSMWNGPLYTLPFEFACYLVIAALVACRLLTPRALLVIAVVVWLWLQLQLLGAFGPDLDTRQTRFTLCFFVGALIYQHRNELLSARRWWLPLSAAVVAITTYMTVGFFQIGVIAFAYLFLWLGCVLPLHGFGTRRDFSYGVYIYGWPVLQLGAYFSLNQLGLWVYLPVSVAATLVLAAISWFLVESPALRFKNANAPAWLSAGARRADTP